MCMNFRRWPDFPWRIWLFTPALGRVLSAVRRCGHSPPGKFQMTDMTDMTASQYSCPSLVVPNTEELISWPFLGENRFWWVLQKRMSTENAVGCLFFSHAHFCLQLQQNTMVPVDVDGQISHFCSQGFVREHSILGAHALLEHSSESIFTQKRSRNKLLRVWHD